jgi:hypothetical protein
MRMIKLPPSAGRLAAAATAGAAVIAVTGVAVAGATSGARTDATRRTSLLLAYTCQFPSGTQPVGVRIAAGFPAAATVGQAIQPTDVHVTITVPQAGLGDLRRLGAATVRASASLGVTVAEGRASAPGVWRLLPAQPAARVPAEGSLVQRTTGTVAPARVGSPGTVTLTADRLLLVLVPRKADGTATSPATLAVSCSPSPGQDGQLAALRISGSAPSPSSSPSPSGRSTRRAAPSCFTKTPNPWIGSAFIAGYANASKLNEAALLGPGPDNHPRAGLSDLNLLYLIVDSCKGIFYSYNTGELNYHGKPQLPPARATFLNFGFVPVTATISITLIPVPCRDVTGHFIGNVGLCIVLKQPFTSPNESTTVTSEQRIQVSDVTVNGTPLNVGQHCRTAVPTNVVLTSKAGYDVTKGGVLSGNVTIPPFTGCGVGENLDPLLTASISGPGNFVQLTQGPTCARFLPTGLVNANCRIPPGPGHKFGVPKFFPKVKH